jgi:predicted PurR-regulated permease PerM
MSGRLRRAVRAARTPAVTRRAGGIAIAAPFAFGILAGAGALVAYAGYRALGMISSVVAVVIAAVLLTVAEQRAVLALRNRGVSQRLAVTLVVLAMFLLAVLAILILVPFLVHQFEALAEAFGGYLAQAADTPLGRRVDLSTVIRDVLTPAHVEAIASGVFSGLGALIGFSVAAFSTGAMTIYLLADFDRLSRAAFRAVPASRRPAAIAIGDQILGKIGAYVAGVLAVAVCAGTTAWLFMVLTGIPYAVVLALIVAAFDMIPQVGATIGALAVIVVGLSQSLGVAVAAAVFFIVYQQLENWLIYPRVMRHAVRVSGLAAVVSVLVGTAVAGVFGALVAVPTYAAISIVVREVVLPRQDAR